MSRNSSPLLLTLVLLIGVILGVAFDRGGRLVVAQSSGTIPVGTTGRDLQPPPAAKAETEDALYGQLARQYEQFAQVNRTFELVSKVVAPSVVHIVAHKNGRRDDHKFTFEETGSGVIVRDTRGGRERYVLTNHHVVEGAAPAEIQVFLVDGRVLRPSRVWVDPMADVAVLRLGAVELPSARLGNSDDVAVGSWVLALGSPFGLTHSVSQGIISARGRHEQELHDDGVENQDFLQTDAAINPGNSGGPLVNLKGEVIGINTAIASNGGGSEGVGFSIPINLAKWIMTQLITNGKVSRGAMGVGLDKVKPEQAELAGLDRPRGARVSNVYAASPASAAGIRDGDIILRFNNVEVADLNHLINIVSMAPINQSARVILWRDRREVALSITIGEKEAVLAHGPVPPDPDRSKPGGLLRRSPRPAPAQDPGEPR